MNIKRFISELGHVLQAQRVHDADPRRPGSCLELPQLVHRASPELRRHLAGLNVSKLFIFCTDAEVQHNKRELFATFYGRDKGLIHRKSL
jgi:hypothetical protein